MENKTQNARFEGNGVFFFKTQLLGSMRIHVEMQIDWWEVRTSVALAHSFFELQVLQQLL